jgi:hypothetical protein
MNINFKILIYLLQIIIKIFNTQISVIMILNYQNNFKKIIKSWKKINKKGRNL